MSSGLPPIRTFMAHSEAIGNLERDVSQEARNELKAAILRTVEENGNCSICHDTLLSVRDTITLRCGHCFHDQCMSDFVHHQVEIEPFRRSIRCPLCRRVCQDTYGLGNDESHILWRRSIWEEYPDNSSVIGNANQGETQVTTLPAIISAPILSTSTQDYHSSPAPEYHWQSSQPMPLVFEYRPGDNHWHHAASTPQYYTPPGYTTRGGMHVPVIELPSHQLQYRLAPIYGTPFAPPPPVTVPASYTYVVPGHQANSYSPQGRWIFTHPDSPVGPVAPLGTFHGQSLSDDEAPQTAGLYQFHVQP